MFYYSTNVYLYVYLPVIKNVMCKIENLHFLALSSFNVLAEAGEYQQAM